MPSRHAISTDVRWKVIAKLSSGLEANVIADHLLISRRSVNRIVLLYVMHGNFIPLLSSRGRPRLLNAEDLECLRLLIRKDPDLYLDELAERMTTCLGRPVSKFVVWRSLKRMGYTRKQV